jgi:integrase
VAEEWKGTWGDLAPKTRGGYDSILKNHVLPAFGSMRISAISPDVVQEFVNATAEGRSPNTVRHVMDVVRNVFRVATERRYIAVNPCKAVRLPRRVRRDIGIHPITHADVATLVAALPEHWRLPVLLDAYTGLRAGELWALRRRDVDPLRGEISVQHAIKEVTADSSQDVPEELRLTPTLIVGPTKTHAKRKVSVPAFLRQELADHLAQSLPGGDGREALIFTTANGHPVRHNLFYKRCFAPVVATTFPGRPFRFHDLRHTCATWLIDAGAHPLQIKLRMGHESIRTTMDTYGHPFPSAETGAR